MHASFVSVFSTGYHTAIACSDNSVVCTMDALTETFLPPTPTQHEKARGKRSAWPVVGIILLVVRLSYTGLLNLRASEPCEPKGEPVRATRVMRAMRAKGRVMRVMRAMRTLVQMLRVFICYIYIHMRTRTRATEQNE